jgi:hypothetical protein
MNEKDRMIPASLVAAIVSAAMSGADIVADGETGALFCVTPKAASAVEAIGKGDRQEVGRDEVVAFLRRLVREQGVSVFGVMPDGTVIRLTDKEGSEQEARPDRCH